MDLPAGRLFKNLNLLRFYSLKSLSVFVVSFATPFVVVNFHISICSQEILTPRSEGVNCSPVGVIVSELAPNTGEIEIDTCNYVVAEYQF